MNHHRYTYIPSPLNFPPIPLPIPHPWADTEHRVRAPCIMQQTPAGCLSYRWWCVCLDAPLSVHPLLSFHTVSISLFSSLRLHCCPADRFILLDSLYMH